MSKPNTAGTNNKLPVSQSKLLANIANSLLSTGPKSEAGKVRAAMNARRHGLTGQFYVMNDADRLAYNTFEQGFLDTLAPVGPVETQFAISIAQDHWRLNRSRAIEYNTYGLGHHQHEEETDANSPEVAAAITQAKTWRDANHGFTLITLYETRVRRVIALNEKRLEELQTVRKAAEAKAREEAELLLCQAVMNGEDLHEEDSIEVGGFVFSPTSLIQVIKRREALESARFYKRNGWDNSEPWRGGFNFPPVTPRTQPKAA